VCQIGVEGSVPRIAAARLAQALPIRQRARVESGREGAMGYNELRLLSVEREEGVARVTIDAPPINLLGAELIAELDACTRELARDDDLKVVVLRSADPDFFVAHADVELIARLPERPAPPPSELSGVHRIFERLRCMPRVTIAQVEGFARGGGSELALACDMRFAALGKAVFGQPEVALGILPGAGGTYRLTRLLGRARACEVILGCEDYSAAEAERMGWVNRALPPGTVEPFVRRLARRIASFPARAIAEVKRVIDRAGEDVGAGLLAEQTALESLLAGGSERVARMRRFLELGCQTRAGEHTLGADCVKLAPRG
jgi:enoyl-CoA hydratase/carnithine racemase